MTAAATMELVVDARHRLGEGILWDERNARLLWTDIEGSALHAVAPARAPAPEHAHEARKRWDLPERLCSMALTHDDDRLLLALASGLAFFDLASSRLDRLCDVEAHLPTTRLNDGRTDREGRFVFGSFNQAVDPKAAIGGFHRLNTDLTLERLPLGDVAIANSICFSPDGRTMYYADSLTCEIRCCDYGPDGSIGTPRVFASADAAPGEPDGSTVDADGFLWNARWGAGQVVRFAPDGSVDRVLHLPAPHPTCPAFGGTDLDVLYVTSATDHLSPEQRRQWPASGGVFARGVGVRGLPENRFGRPA